MICLQGAAALLRVVLRNTQPLVTQHLGQEATAIARADLRQELQLFLTREVGVEELLAGHADAVLQVRCSRHQRRWRRA